MTAKQQFIRKAPASMVHTDGGSARLRCGGGLTSGIQVKGRMCVNENGPPEGVDVLTGQVGTSSTGPETARGNCAFLDYFRKWLSYK